MGSKFNISKNKNLLLSDKIADILSTAPDQFDPEDDIYEETVARVTSSSNLNQEETDNNVSKIRKKNLVLLDDVDKRYIGEKSSRKSFQTFDNDSETDDSSGDESETSENIDNESNKYVKDNEGAEEASEKNSLDEHDENSDVESSSSAEGENDELEYESSKNDTDEDSFKHVSKLNSSDHAKKGKAVRNQLNLWENLLEIRIQLQKCLLTANKFPQQDTFATLNKETEFRSALSKSKNSISEMLNKFLFLQQLLIKQYSETKDLLNSKGVESNIKNESEDEICSDTEETDLEDVDSEPPKKMKKLCNYESLLKQRDKKFKSYRNGVIQKWNDKTKLAAGKKYEQSNSVLQQIEFLLKDKQKLFRRSQLKKSEFEILGKKQDSSVFKENEAKRNEYDVEIYDDTDFYHQLLRELIEVKSGDVTDPIQMSRQWIAIQNFRSKMKRKIDTKATKGRKIRYAVHSKLVNFMAPICENSWTNEAKNELFSSLFGHST